LLAQNGSSCAKCGFLCARSPQTRNICVCSSRPLKDIINAFLTGSSSLNSCRKGR
jgi:hypothetical protein